LIAEALGVSHSTILSHLRESLGMKTFHLCWNPHDYRELLPILKAHEKSSKICDWGQELVHFGISSFYGMERIGR
jgi:hypothetical protein